MSLKLTSLPVNHTSTKPFTFWTCSSTLWTSI